MNKTEKIKSIAVISLTGAFLAGFSGFAWLKPDDAFSLSERRLLAQLPTVSPLDSSFSTKFDSYATDQFPLRDIFRTIKANTATKLLMQKDNHDIYVVNGSASEIDYPLDEKSILHAADRLKNIYNKCLDETNDIYFSVVPDKGAFIAAENGYPAYEYDTLREKFAESMDFATEIRIDELLSIDDYYLTDSHWSQDRLLPIADRIASAMGVELNAEYETVTLDSPFYGVYSGRSGLSLKPDQLKLLTNELLDSLTVYDAETSSDIPVYDLTKAEGRDPYETFLSGSKSLLTVKNPNASTDRRLMIFRDSFGSSLSPLFFEGWSEVTIIDIRYITPDILPKLLDFENADVLFIYSASVINNSETLK